MISDAMRWNLFGVDHNTDTPDSDGVVWTVARSKGWLSPSIVSSRALPSGRSGSVLTAERHGERTLEIFGMGRAPTQAQAEAGWNRLPVMPGVGASGVVTRYEVVPKSLRVRMDDEPLSDPPAGGVFFYQLALVALDPYKLALTAKTVALAAGATVTLTNDGTATAYLAATATGSGTVQLRQDDSGQVLRSKASVASGTVFDSGLRQVRSGGGVVLSGVVDNPSEWLSIPRLASTSVTNQGTAPLSVTFYDSYA